MTMFRKYKFHFYVRFLSRFIPSVLICDESWVHLKGVMSRYLRVFRRNLKLITSLKVENGNVEFL